MELIWTGSKEMDKEEGVVLSGWSGVGRPLTAAVVPTPSKVKHTHHLSQREISFISISVGDY